MSVSHTGQGLYPIIRRVRRPLLPVEPEVAKPAAAQPPQPAKDGHGSDPNSPDAETPATNASANAQN
jgi:hypothetical protein